MLIDDYFVHQINFEKKYGKKTIVLMQVGSFFEFYGVNNDDEKIGNPQIITEMLNIQLTRRNKNILENNRSNCLMAGFPLVSLKRFINILLSNNYTIILIEQTSEPPNPKREITQIFSPGTYIDEMNHSDPNNIISLYLSEESSYKNGQTIFSFGISSIDLSTGYNIIYQDSIIYYEKNAFFEEIYRFIESFNPKEIIVSYNNLNKIKIDDIRLKINSNDKILHINPNIDNKLFNLNFQNSFLKKIFTNHGNLSPIEFIDLEKKNYALISYLILLQFSFEHNERIIEKIKIPEHWEYNDHLILYNNAIYQLNIVSNNTSNNASNNHIDSKFKSLFDIIQKTSTNMGKRLLKYRILNPITNIKELNKRYNIIDCFLNSNKIIEIEKLLNEIIDIERLHRKISLEILHPYEFLNLSYSYDNILKVIDLIINNFDIALFDINNQVFENFKEFINGYEKLFDMKEIGKYGLSNITNSFFKKGNFCDIDNKQDEIDLIYKYFENESFYLSNLIENKSDFVKLENNDREGYFFYTTKKRSDILITKFNKDEKNKYEIKKYNGANIKIVSEELTANSNKLIILQNEIKILTKEQYLKKLNYFYDIYGNVLNEITKFIAIIDINKCAANCVIKYKYCKPTILDNNNGKSYFNATEIRHPIIEVINDEFDYVNNDIELLHSKYNGILLYGVNGSGKSSLSKAIGCNILLAQIGFFVPSKEFIFYPYKKIFTRINGDDNIFKGMSSFAVEMDELRSILKYSDNRSIVLGDEICKGTEETSALSIVSASIIRFCQNNVNFIFATHFHKLYELECIKNMNNIKFMHLSINYDIDNEIIIYGRKLKDGPGDNLYGIEIANYIINDENFIKNAKMIRNTILNKNDSILNNKISNYNNKLFIDKCSICGDNGYLVPLDTHHIKEQNTFDKNDFNKDKLSNLVILCKKHHDEVHFGNLEINGYIDTVVGKKLEFNINEKKSKENNSKKKFNNHQINIIKNLIEEYKEHKHYLKIVILELKKQNIIISENTLKKIKDNIY
jgi:DNA mismatch repair protein MutS